MRSQSSEALKLDPIPRNSLNWYFAASLGFHIALGLVLTLQTLEFPSRTTDFEVEIIGDGKTRTEESVPPIAKPTPRIQRVKPTKPVVEESEVIETQDKVVSSPNENVSPSPSNELWGREARNAKEVFMRELRRKIEANKSYPLLAKRKNIEGRVVLLLRVNEKGAFDRVELAESSSQEILDQAAYQLINRLSGKVELDKALAQGPFEILVPIEYVLKK